MLLLLAAPLASQPTAPALIPLCDGLRIVTAVNDRAGDYESIKTVDAVTAESVRITYSSESMVQDLFDTAPTLRKTNLVRVVRREDLTAAAAYLQRFTEHTPELVPGTTALGTSAAVLTSLRRDGRANLAIFGPFAGPVPLDRGVHPNVYDNQMTAEAQRVGFESVRLIVNGQVAELPAIRVEANFYGDLSEFHFLDDPDNPLTLKFRIGIRPPDPAKVEMARVMGDPLPTSGDRETLQVIRITHRCGELSADEARGGAGAGAGASGLPGGAGSASGLERALAESGHADVYDIYFSFNSAEIRAESEPMLREIGDLLARHPDWRLTIAGHTDAIASDSYNLDLSRRRAAAVKQALTTRYRVAPGRLATTGHGESQPRDTNDTLEGRARNRRVELVRRPK
ncbi:MAG: OmpA family protein [Vicinamibacterales bacterium]